VDEDDNEMERRKADRELYDELARNGFDGRSWDLFATEMARYSRGILMAWFYIGKMWQECQAIGWSLGPLPRDWTRDDRAELANETVASALHRFREKARNGDGWCPDRGASLKTYIVGSCVREFPNVFRPWRRSEQKLDRVDLTPDPISATLSDDPTDIAIQRLQICEAFAAIPDEATRRAFFLKCHKYTYDEIRKELGLTSGELRKVAEQLREEFRRLQRKPEGDPDE
jgi:DNA-directed RNA polymerase specialized sigma24 family protein